MRRGIYVIAILSLVGGGGWLLLSGRDKKTDAQIVSTVLPASDQIKVVSEPHRGIVTVVNRAQGGAVHSKSTYVGHRPYSVDITKDGAVSVSHRAFGTEVSPFVGVSIGSDLGLRGAVGLNLLYWQRWDLGGGLLVSSNVKDTRLFAHVGYNVYDAIELSIGVDNRHTAHLLASLKF